MPIQGYSLIRRIAMGTDWRQKTYPVMRISNDPRIAQLLEKPSWSVRSLLPEDINADTDSRDIEITREKLHHLLKLSALPPPSSQAEEDRMLRTLKSQIHFVKEVQSVDTTGVEPLEAIRDETNEAVQENTVTLEKLQPWLNQEERVGKNGTLRRIKKSDSGKGLDKKILDWDPFAMGPDRSRRQMGRYFFVKKEKKSTSNVRTKVIDGKQT